MAADEISPSEIAVTGPADQEPPMDMISDMEVHFAVMPVAYIDPTMDAPPEIGGLEPLPVPYELVMAEIVPEPQLPDQPGPVIETLEPQLSDEPIRVVYYSLGGEGFDPTVIRNFGLEEDPAAAAVERVMTKVIDQAADTAVQPLTPAPL